MPANHGQAPKFKDTVYYSEYMHASRRRGTGVGFSRRDTRDERRHRHKTAGVRDKLFARLGFFRSRSKGHTTHDSMCHSACEFTRADDEVTGTAKATVFTQGFSHETFITVEKIRHDAELQRQGLATAKCVMDPARLVMHERKSAHRSESLVRGLSRNGASPRKSTRELLSEQRRERAAVARSEETSVRLQLVFDGIAASGTHVWHLGEALQLEEDDVHLVSDGFHLRDVVDAAKKGDLRTRRGWIARVLRARTAAQHAIRNAVGTDNEIHGVDLQNCIMMSDVMASFGIKGIGATLHEVEVLWEGMLHDLGLPKHHPILTFTNFYRWQVKRSRQLLDPQSKLLLVHVLERDAFVDEFRYWDPMMDRLVELLDTAAERRYFKQQRGGVAAAPAAALAGCGCGGGLRLESSHHPRSDFVVAWEKKDQGFSCV